MESYQKYIEDNTVFAKFVNQLTLWLTLLARNRSQITSDAILQYPPLFVTGFFRSGTSLVTNILSKSGLDIGPENHLLKAKGSRAILNRDGFFENYLFMDLSLYLFNLTNSWGHHPPSVEEIKKIDFDLISFDNFPQFSICGIHDDRISNFNKFKVLKNFDGSNLKEYLKHEFGLRPLIKNPHFSVLWPWIDYLWPNSQFLVCFRNPNDAINSANLITKELNESVYMKYYTSLMQIPSERVFWFSYDNLMNNPEYSLRQLMSKVDLNPLNNNELISIVDHKYHRFKDDFSLSDGMRQLYLEMLNRSINRL